MKLKRIAALLLTMAAAFLLAACGAKTPPGPPPDLTGDWVQPSDGEWYHIATITDDTIQIWWYLPSEDERNLYWTGSFTPPEDDSEPYVWESANAYTEAQLSLSYANRRATREETKTFTYQKGKISYSVTAGHLRMTFALQKAEE